MRRSAYFNLIKLLNWTFNLKTETDTKFCISAAPTQKNYFNLALPPLSPVSESWHTYLLFSLEQGLVVFEGLCLEPSLPFRYVYIYATGTRTGGLLKLMSEAFSALQIYGAKHQKIWPPWPTHRFTISQSTSSVQQSIYSGFFIIMLIILIIM